MSGGFGSWLRGLMAPRADAGGAERWLAVDDPDNGYYNFRLMRFAADGDLVRYPDHIWSTATRWNRPGGLRAHLQEVASRMDGVVYSDVLVLLSAEDRQRQIDRGAADWEDQLQALLSKQIERLCDPQGWLTATPERPVTVRVVGDGEPAMGGRPLGLDPGEFATALLPNLYHGPLADSRPFVDVYIRVPRSAGGQGGFRQVGILHHDQLAFTIGSHWLDNGRDASLPASALYTLHRPPDREGLLHRLNPDLADAYQLRQTEGPQGATVSVEDAEAGRVVLEVMLIPSRPRPTAASLSGEPDEVGSAAAGGMTVIPEPEPDPRVILSRRALLLQRVHFPRVMDGYHVDIAGDGSVGPHLPDPAARLTVRGDALFLGALADEVGLDGKAVDEGAEVPLTGRRHEIATDRGGLVLTLAEPGADPRWPYLGELSLPAEPHELAIGSTHRIGRDRRKCEVALADRAVNENIQWCAGVDPTGTIPTRGGQVPASSFTTDSIMVAGRHAEVDLRGSEPKVRALSRACPVFVRRRSGAVLRLIAKDGATAQPLRQGDELLIGNTLFRVILPHGTQPSLRVDISPGGGSTSGALPRGGGSSADGPSSTNPPVRGGDARRARRVEARQVSRALPLLGPQTDLSLPRRPRAETIRPTPPPPTPSDPTLVEEVDSGPDEDRYGDVPRSLRRRPALPQLAGTPEPLDEGMTVMDTR